MLKRMDLWPELVLERLGPALTQQAFSTFGRLLGTDAPIHDDPDYAQTTAFGGTIAQGMLLAAPYESWLCALFGTAAWTAGGRIAVRLRHPAWVGDAVLMRLSVSTLSDRQCEFDIESQCRGRTLLTGSASLVLPA